MPERIALADGRTVSAAAVAALDALDARWPGATLPQARAAIVAAVEDVLDAERRDAYAAMRAAEREPYEDCPTCMQLGRKCESDHK